LRVNSSKIARPPHRAVWASIGYRFNITLLLMISGQAESEA
jgi:hypothetical protein